MIKAITFDLDGVYFTSESFRDFKNNHPKKVTNPEIVDQVFFKSEETKKFRKGEIDEDTFWSYVKNTLGISLPNSDIFQLLAASYHVQSDVVDLVKKVRSLGYKTCICTNNYPTRIRLLDQKFSFLSDFDVHVFSYQVGAIKPDPKIYQTLISAVACQPEEIVYSDDKLDNVVAAQNLGINAFVYQDFPDFLSRLRDLGVTI